LLDLAFGSVSDLRASEPARTDSATYASLMSICPVVEPVDFAWTDRGHRTKNDRVHAAGMSLGVGESQHGTPAHTEHYPAVDAKILPEQLDITDEMWSRVGLKTRRMDRRMRCAASTTTLSERNRPEDRRVEELRQRTVQAGTWTSMKDHDRQRSRLPPCSRCKQFPSPTRSVPVANGSVVRGRPTTRTRYTSRP